MAMMPAGACLRHLLRREPSPSQDERGAALLVVLVFCALLAMLAGVTLESAGSGARAAIVFLDATQADELGRGAADAVAFEIVSGGPAAQRGGAFSIHLDRADIDVTYRSESARVDVNTAPAGLLAAMLEAAGADPAAIAGVNASLSGGPASKPASRIHAAEGTQDDLAEVARDPATAPAASPRRRLYEQPLQALEEWHVPADVRQRLLPVLTVANGTTKVDPILADRLVVSALIGGDEARVDDYLQRREQGFAEPGSALALLPVGSQAFAGFSDVSAVRALVLVTVAHRFKRRYEIVLDPPAFPGELPKVLSWRPLF